MTPIGSRFVLMKAEQITEAPWIDPKAYLRRRSEPAIAISREFGIDSVSVFVTQ